MDAKLCIDLMAESSKLIKAFLSGNDDTSKSACVPFHSNKDQRIRLGIFHFHTICLAFQNDCESSNCFVRSFSLSWSIWSCCRIYKKHMVTFWCNVALTAISCKSVCMSIFLWGDFLLGQLRLHRTCVPSYKY